MYVHTLSELSDKVVGYEEAVTFMSLQNGVCELDMKNKFFKLIIIKLKLKALGLMFHDIYFLKTLDFFLAF